MTAWCRATIPPERLRQRTADHTGIGDHLCHLALCRPGPDGLREVDIGVRVGGDASRHGRQRAHEVLVVDGAEGGIRRRGEFAQHEAPTRPGHPRKLTQGLRRVGDIAQPEGHGHRIEGPISKRQVQRVGRGEDQVRTAPLADLEHPEGEVRGDDVDACGGIRLGTGPRARGDIEDPLAGLRGHGRHDLLAPAPVLAEAEDVVGAVVLGGNVVEHCRDLARLLLQARATHAPIIPHGSGGDCV